MIRSALTFFLPLTAMALIGPRAMAIDHEINGAVELMAPDYLDDATQTFWSYSHLTHHGQMDCSAAFISPNIYMTSASCGQGQPGAVGEPTVYRNQSAHQDQSQTPPLNCTYLLDTRNANPNATDLLLMWCDDAGDHAPGNLYGYVDLEPRSVSANEPLFAYWHNDMTNPPQGPALNRALLYSDGQATNPEPLELMGISYATDLWCKHTGVGSPILNPATHRALLGPTSRCSDTDPQGTAFRAAGTTLGYTGLTTSPTGPASWDLNHNLIINMGLNPNDYNQNLDGDLNGLWDLVEDMQRAHLNGNGEIIWAGFDSHQRNQNWRVFAPTSATVSFSESPTITGSSPAIAAATRGDSTVQVLNLTPNQPALAYDRLDLKKYDTYRVHFQLYVQNHSGHGILELELSDDVGYSQTHLVKTVNVGQWVPYSFEFVAGVGMHTLQFSTEQSTTIDFQLRDVVISHVGYIHDFDSHDNRLAWHGEASDERPFILPDGDAAGIDWAGLAEAPNHIQSSYGQSLNHDSLGLMQNEDVQICFKYKAHTSLAPSDPNYVTQWGGVMLADHGSIILQESFSPTSSWQNYCTQWIQVPTADMTLSFGAFKYTNPSSFLVDDVEIRKQGQGEQGPGY